MFVLRYLMLNIFILIKCLIFVLDALYDALQNFSWRRNDSFDRFELTFENARLSEKIIVLETKIDRLVDYEAEMQRSIEYWRGMYQKQCDKLRKLQKVHRFCPKKSIILYR